LADSVEKVESAPKQNPRKSLPGQISSEDAFSMRRRRSPKGSVQVDEVHRV